jgi:RNA polymerase sigma-70 factor (ECF subfamily)
MTPASLLATTRPDSGEAAAAPTDVASALCAETPRVRRLVHRLLGWSARADELDDVVQDVLLKAWRNRATFRGDASLATWLASIAIRAAHDHARRTAVRRRLFAWLLPPDAPAPEPAGEPEPLERTRLAMQRLPHADREVLVLRYLEQRDVEAVAALLGVSRAAVDARLSRARQRLRAALATEPSR